VGKVLATKLGNSTSLNCLYEITDVPDLGAGTMHGAISLEQIIKLRNSRHWREFANWFHEVCATEPNRVGREYVKLLRAEGKIDSPFFKTIRLLISSVVGLISPLAGVAASAADTFLVPRLKEPSAKYFVEELEQLSANQIKNAL